MLRPRTPTVWFLIALVGASCSGSGGGTPAGTTSSPAPTGSSPTSSPGSPSSDGPSLADVRVELEQVAALEQPLALAVRTGDEVLYIAERTGRVVALRGSGDPEVVLDLSAEVSTEGNEQGLLGLAFSPDGRFLYVDYTDLQWHTHVTEFAFGDDGVDLSSRREVLFVEDRYVNHNGGNLVFGPDGYLYIGLGDGGSAADPHGNGQSRSTLLGKMLRISPRPEGGEPYGIPPDNPYASGDEGLPEIWSYGLRNPWRYSFDRETGDLWIGDVGQNAWEEIDVEPAGSEGGLNYGWNAMEGTRPFEGGPGLDGAVAPVYEYPTGEGCAVTGGFVYRGDDIPDLVGAYLFGDFCRGMVEAFVLRDGRATEHRELGVAVEGLSSFGQDADGELYVLSLAGPVYRLVPAGS